MSGLRILHWSSIRWNSAIAEYALSAARSLRDRGHETRMVVLDGAPLLTRATAHQLQTTSLPSFALTQILRARAIIDEFKPDVMITYGGPETILAGLANTAKVPLFRVRGYAAEPSFFSGLTHDLGQWGVSGMITPSQRLAETLAGISKIKTASVPLGIDTVKYQGHPVDHAGRRPSLVIFGRFDPVKGHHDFMRRFRLILNQWQSDDKPILKIVGEPANISVRHLEEFAAQEGLVWGEDVVVHAGRLDDVPRLLSEATVGVVSSVGSEIICRVAEEFLCCGTPVFVSGVGSLPEVLIDESMGLSYEGLDAATAAEKMKRKLEVYRVETARERENRGVAARAAFSLAAMGLRLEEFISQKS